MSDLTILKQPAFYRLPTDSANTPKVSKQDKTFVNIQNSGNGSSPRNANASRVGDNQFYVTLASKASNISSEKQADQIASAIRLQGGVGEYFAIGIDLPDVLTAGFSRVMGLALRKLGVPSKTIAGLEKMFIAFAAKGKALGGSIGTIPRLEFNCSFLLDEKAQRASGNFHFKFSPVSYPEVQAQIVKYKAALSIFPNTGTMIAALSKLQTQIDRAGKLKPGTSPLLSALYAGIVKDANPSPPMQGPREAPKGLNQGPLGLFDSRLTVNWLKAFNGENPDIRLGRMYVAVGLPEKLNLLVARNEGLGRTVKFATAPYVSPRVSIENGKPAFQIVIGAGGLGLGSEDSFKALQTNKAFVFPGFYVVAKLSFGENNTFVRVNQNTVGVRMSINGTTVVVSLPPELFKSIENFIVGSDRQLKLSSLASGEKFLDLNGVFTEFLTDKLPPELLKLGEKVVQQSKEVAGAINSPMVQDTGILLAGVMGYQAGPVVGTITTGVAILDIIARGEGRAFDNFYNAFTKRLAGGANAPTVLADITRTMELLVSAYESIPVDRRGRDVVGQLRIAAFKTLSFYDAAIKKAASQGSLPGGILRFYKELETAASSNNSGALRTLIAKNMLGLADASDSGGARDAKGIILSVTHPPPTSKKFFPLIQSVDRMAKAGSSKLQDSQVSDILMTETPKIAREIVDYYTSKGGDPKHLVTQLRSLRRRLEDVGKYNPALQNTYLAMMSNPALSKYANLQTSPPSKSIGNARLPSNETTRTDAVNLEISKIPSSIGVLGNTRDFIGGLRKATGDNAVYPDPPKPPPGALGNTGDFIGGLGTALGTDLTYLNRSKKPSPGVLQNPVELLAGLEAASRSINRSGASGRSSDTFRTIDPKEYLRQQQESQDKFDTAQRKRVDEANLAAGRRYLKREEDQAARDAQSTQFRTLTQAEIAAGGFNVPDRRTLPLGPNLRYGNGSGVRLAGTTVIESSPPVDKALAQIIVRDFVRKGSSSAYSSSAKSGDNFLRAADWFLARALINAKKNLRNEDALLDYIKQLKASGVYDAVISLALTNNALPPIGITADQLKKNSKPAPKVGPNSARTPGR